eukprot:849183-Prorocentrum_minimum.AAC.1
MRARNLAGYPAMKLKSLFSFAATFCFIRSTALDNASTIPTSCHYLRHNTSSRAMRPANEVVRHCTCNSLLR